MKTCALTWFLAMTFPCRESLCSLRQIWSIYVIEAKSVFCEVRAKTSWEPNIEKKSYTVRPFPNLLISVQNVSTWTLICARSRKYTKFLFPGFYSNVFLWLLCTSCMIYSKHANCVIILVSCLNPSGKYVYHFL